LESLGALTAGIAREVAQPISNALHTAEQLRAQLPQESGLLELADDVIRDCGRTLSIVQSLSRFTAPSTDIPGAVDPAETLEEVLALVRRQLTVDDQITLTVDVSSNLPPVRAERSELAQALAGLLLHARDAVCERYSGAHPGKQLRATATALPDTQHVRISISDSGRGLPDDACERVFDSISSIEGMQRDDRVALSLIRRTIANQQGEMSVESKLGLGSTFHIDLPRADHA
jgi:signal transduction histidine kinase